MKMPSQPHRAKTSSGKQNSSRKASYGALLAYLALVPLPFGSARPIFWAASAVFIGLSFAVYSTVSAQFYLQRRRWTILQKVNTLSAFVFAAFLIIQLIPGTKTISWLNVITQTGIELSPNQISLAPGMTVLVLIKHLSCVLYAALMFECLQYSVTRRSNILDVTLVIIVTYAFYAMIALRYGDTILGMEKVAYEGFATGPYINRNTFATLLAIGITIASVRTAAAVVSAANELDHIIASNDAWRWAALYGAALGFLAVTLLATQSRMGLFVGAIGAVVGCVLVIVKARRWRLRIFLTVFAIAVLGVVVVWLQYGRQLVDQLSAVQSSAQVRIAVYVQVLELIGRRPLTGFGGGSFEIAYPLVHVLPADAEKTWDRAHNTYLTLWAELGLVAGSIPILLVLFWAAAIGRSFCRRAFDSDSAPQAAALSVALVVGLHSIVDFSLEILSIAVFFVTVLIAGLASTSASNRLGRHPKHTIAR
jgi:O-antigen ligase